MSLCPTCLALWASMPPTLPEAGCQGLSLPGILKSMGMDVYYLKGRRERRKYQNLQCCWLRKVLWFFFLRRWRQKEKEKNVAPVRPWQEDLNRRSTHASYKSILNHRLPLVSLDRAGQTLGNTYSVTDAGLPFHVKIKKASGHVTKGSLLFSASSGSCGPGAFPLCDQGVAIAWVKMPSSWAGFVLQPLQNNRQCSHLNGPDNLESIPQ